MIYYFYKIDWTNQYSITRNNLIPIGHYFDYNNEYDIEYVKDDDIRVLTTSSAYNSSSEIKDISHLVYKKTDFIPERDEFRLSSINGTASLYHRKIDDFCRIQHLEYDETWDVKNCNYMDYRQFLSECRDLGLTIPTHLIR